MIAATEPWCPEPTCQKKFMDRDLGTMESDSTTLFADRDSAMARRTGDLHSHWSDLPPLGAVVEIEARPIDVLLGRGRSHCHHRGNQRFQSLLEEYAPRYNATNSRIQKGHIAQQLIAQVQSNGGHFLRRADVGSRWIRISHSEVRVKVSQALRYKHRKGTNVIPENNSATTSYEDAGDASTRRPSNPILSDDTILQALGYSQEDTVSTVSSAPVPLEGCDRKDLDFTATAKRSAADPSRAYISSPTIKTDTDEESSCGSEELDLFMDTNSTSSSSMANETG